MEGKMKRLRLIAVTGAVALLAAGLGGSGSSGASAASKGPISIGALTSLTGPFTPWGVEVRDGMQFAVRQINAKGGVKGRKLNLVVADDQSSPNGGIDGFRRLTEQEHVVSIGGLIRSDVAPPAGRPS